MNNLNDIDKEIFTVIKNETKRQEEHIELIASENFVSKAVMEAQGSVLTNKYAEGYPGKRYYGGCEHVDVAESLAIERVCKLFGAKYANVQAHSGSQANMAAIRSLVKNGDTVLGMSLNDGGHLTHGHPLNFSGIDYNIVSYGVDNDTHLINYDNVRDLALKNKPKLIIAGASAYPRSIDFKKFKEIASEVGAYLMVDMAHIAGLCCTGLHQNPIEFADVVTSTTHKTLRGPRGGLILTNNEEIIKLINRNIFPGIQGGPLMHVIAAKAVSFNEALSPLFKDYQSQVISNANALSNEFIKLGYNVISKGTDNHLMLIDIKSSIGLTGKKAEQVLVDVNITCNKNSIPNDSEKPFVTSGIRLGTPAITSRGLKEKEMTEIATLIDTALRNHENNDILAKVKSDVINLMSKYPLNY